jgi:hypothetical protein
MNRCQARETPPKRGHRAAAPHDPKGAAVNPFVQGFVYMFSMVWVVLAVIAASLYAIGQLRFLVPGFMAGAMVGGLASAVVALGALAVALDRMVGAP